MSLVDLLGQPLSGNPPGFILPFREEIQFSWGDCYGCAANASNALLSQSGTTENPRDHQAGFMPYYVPVPISVIGFRAIIRNVVAAGVVTSLVTRLALYNTNATTGLPDSPVTGTDTGAVTVATARSNAGNWAETGSSGNARVQWNLATPVTIAPGIYWRLLAIESVYTGSSETAYSLVGPGGVDYALIGASTTASLRRSFGFAKGEGATSSLTNWTLPTAQGSSVSNFVDLNASGMSLGSVSLLCQRAA